MNTRVVLIQMLNQLLQDMMVLHQQGAGYYSCSPIIRRYNKLLEQSAKLAPSAGGLFATFEPLEDEDPKDPADKMIVIQGIRVEIGQLVTLLEALDEDSE